MTDRLQTSTEVVPSWEIFVVGDARRPLPLDAQILRLIDPLNRVEYILGQPPVVAGRSALADLPLDWPGLGRVHCRFEWHGDRWTVSDLESERGIAVNGRRQTRCELRPGDELSLAGRVLEVDQIAVLELV